MESLLTIQSLAAFLTLTVMEIVLGIDNIVFIAILADKLPEHQRHKARQIGLFLAMFVRVVLLLAISWIMGLVTPLFTLPFTDPHTGERFAISGRDLIMLLGGGFLIYKATHEIHDKLEGSKETLHQPELVTSAGGGAQPAGQTFKSVVTQIVLLDIVFSLDSVITAVGMVKAQEGQTWQPLAIMIAAVIVAVAVMLIFAGPLSAFISKHPTTKMLALSFLLLIGVVLVAEGLHQHIGKGYIYSAMVFSVLVEMLNLRVSKKKHAAASSANPPAA